MCVALRVSVCVHVFVCVCLSVVAIAVVCKTDEKLICRDIKLLAFLNSMDTPCSVRMHDIVS